MIAIAPLLKALTVLLCFSMCAVIMLLLSSRCPCQRCLRSKARRSLHSLRFSRRLRLGFCQVQPHRCSPLTRTWIRRQPDSKEHPPCCCCMCYYYYSKYIIMPVLLAAIQCQPLAVPVGVTSRCLLPVLCQFGCESVRGLCWCTFSSQACTSSFSLII